ncbi:dnaJ homolog subfamily B member 4-like [Glycine max]|uniref:dnaJ homolog subfamily B member 4-like n=1 Tax=Glycine max TaxID=3847 RepID=UPI000E21B4D0|nr:dnaJ homolog subfamily B member 4-like [Glycine max]|eukprot:XP_025983198.1 dnaJ homolog subfamily B member 4-like [Glycine max]
MKQGWGKGRKITFEGVGDEKPGYLPVDIVFLIDEIKQPLFRREGNDLEICVQIPLVDALIGCSISIPLLGGENMGLSFENNVIYPGYEKVIKGQGMPNPKNNGIKGDLHVQFFIEFPIVVCRCTNLPQNKIEDKEVAGCVICGGAHDSGCCLPNEEPTAHEVNYMGNQPINNFNAGGFPGFQHGQQYNQQQGHWRNHPGNQFNRDQGGPSTRPQQQRPSLYECTTKLEETLA